MPGLQSGKHPYHVTLTTADGFEVGLIAVVPTGKNGEAMPHEFEGTLTPVDATEEFRPGGIPREFADFSAGAGYSYYDSRVPNGYAWAKNVITWIPHVAVPSGALTEVALPAGTHAEIRTGFERSGHLFLDGSLRLQGQRRNGRKCYGRGRLHDDREYIHQRHHDQHGVVSGHCLLGRVRLRHSAAVGQSRRRV